jgi:anaerobic selenocysteine-containing dehydrogenase
MTATTHHRTCSLCEACCGLLITVEQGAVTKIVGDPEDPLSRGHICPKGTALADIQADPERLRQPMKRVGAVGDPKAWVAVSWDEAFADITERFAQLRERYGDDAIASYVGNPNAHNYANVLHLSGLLRHFSKRNRFSASTVDQMPHHMVSYWMFGHMSMFTVPDVDRTDYMMIIGGNPLASNGSLWTVPDVKKRLQAVIKRGGKVVVIDPRRTETAEIASEHHFIRPSQDAAFLIGLLLSMRAQGLVRPGRLDVLSHGWDAVWAALDGFAMADLASACAIDAATIARLARELASAPSGICYGRIGVSTQAYGTLCQWLITLINVATGHLDQPGGPMFTTPAVDLLPHTSPGSFGRHRSRVSGAPEACGELPAGVLAEEILTPGDGQVRGLFTCAGNPVLSNPNGRQLEQAFASLDFMVSVDSYINETTRFAHYVLPPCGPLEKSKFDLFFLPIAVRNVARFSPPTLAKTEGAKNDWEIIAELGTRLAQRLDTPQNPPIPPETMIDMGLKTGPHGLSVEQLLASPSGIDLGPLQSRLPDRLFTADKRIQLAPPALIEDVARYRAAMGELLADGQLILIGRRHVRSNNSWMHQYQRLVKGPDRCTLMMHPDDARARNLGSGSKATLASRVGAVEVTVEITDAMMPGVVSLPHGWGHSRQGTQISTAVRHAGVSINDVTDHAIYDPLSGTAAVSGVAVEVRAA